MGVLHALCNNADRVGLGGWVGKFREKTLGMDPRERCEALEEDDELDRCAKATAGATAIGFALAL